MYGLYKRIEFLQVTNFFFLDDTARFDEKTQQTTEGFCQFW